MSEQNFVPTGPDYYIFPRQLPAPETDLGEVAARLGALSTYRRTGRIIWYDGFIGLYGWDYSGNPNSFASSVLQRMISPASLRASPGTTSTIVSIKRILPPILETCGLECSLLPRVNGTGGPLTFPKQTILYVDDHKGPNHYIYTFYILWNLSKIQIKIGDLSIIDVLNFYPFQTGLYGWHNMKFTLNLAGFRYGLLMFDDQTVSLNNYSPVMSGAPLGKNLVVQIDCQNENGYNNDTYIADLLLSTNEVV